MLMKSEGLGLLNLLIVTQIDASQPKEKITTYLMVKDFNYV